MHNKPVAWMCQDNVTDEWEFSSMKHCHKCEPLYTHPVKELTMIEIEDFINAYGLDMGDVYEFSLAQLTKMIVEIEHQIKGGK